MNDESVLARHAVIEGQATMVMLDYILAPFGRSVQIRPGIIYQMEDPAVRATYDSELLHNAPMILRESGTFPYRAGLIFEGELLHKGGKAWRLPARLPALRAILTKYLSRRPTWMARNCRPSTLRICSNW